MESDKPRGAITRRYLLKLLGAAGLAGAASLATGCQQAPPPPAPTAVPPVSTAELPKSAPTAALSSAPTAAPTAVAKPAAEVPKGGTLVYAVYREPDRLDPSRSSMVPAQIIHFNIYDCLIALAPDNTFQPWLADSWEMAPDGKSYTFKLKKNVKFHDGTPFNAQAVKYNMDRVHDPKATVALGGAAHGFYVQTDTPDDYTAVIKLNKPWAPFLDVMTYLYRMVSPTAGQKWGDDLAQHPVGSGPFMFKEWASNSFVSLVRNPDYNWASPIFKHQGPAYLDGVTFRLVTEDGTRVAALEKNEAQVMENVPAQEVDRIKNDKKYKMLVGMVPGRPYQYNMNVRKAPTAELAVRQAINFAVSQEMVVKTVYGPHQALGAMTPAHGLLVPNTWGYEKKAAEVYKYDPDKAKQLLEGAGWKVGANGIRQKDGKPLEVLLATWEHGVAEVIQSQLREVGIDYKIQVVPGITSNEMARREEVHMSPLPFVRSDPDVLAATHSRNRETGVEFTFHSNKQLDDLFDAGAAAINRDERLKIYSQIQMIMAEDAMFLPIFHRDNVSAARAEVEGVVFDRGYFPLLYDANIRKA